MKKYISGGGLVSVFLYKILDGHESGEMTNQLFSVTHKSIVQIYFTTLINNSSGAYIVFWMIAPKIKICIYGN